MRPKAHPLTLRIAGIAALVAGALVLVGVAVFVGALVSVGRLMGLV